jgi:hypothetical protein
MQADWNESILEMPSVVDGDDFLVALGPGSGQMLVFRSLGKRRVLGFRLGEPKDEVQIVERLGGAWAQIGRFGFAPSSKGDGAAPIVFNVTFRGKSMVLRQGERVLQEISLDCSPSIFVNVAGTSSASAQYLGGKCRRIETNLRLPNAELTLIPMLHYSRSGSTVVGQLLPRGRIVVVTELYSPGSVIGPRVTGTVWERARNALRFSPTRVEALFSKMVSSNREWLLHEPRLFCEIKLNLFTSEYFNLDPHRYFLYLRHVGVQKVVFLHRRNLLRRLVSALISLESGTWHVFDGTAVKKAKPIYIDVNRVHDPDFSTEFLPLRTLLDRSVAEIERFRRLARLHFEVLELWYEDHIEHDPNVAARAITELYGVPYSAQSSPVLRQNSGTLNSLIANFADVHRALAGTTHEWML